MDSINNLSFAAAAGMALDTLLAGDNRLDTLQIALETIAASANVDRILIVDHYQAGDGPGDKSRGWFDWQRATGALTYGDLQQIDADSERLLHCWRRFNFDDGPIVIHAAQAAPDLLGGLEALDICTIAAVGVELPERFTGSLNVIHSSKQYHWSEEQLVVLQTIARPLINACLRVYADTYFVASDQLARAAFENTTVGFAVVDTEGTMYQVNDALCSLFGYTREQLIGRNTLMFAHPDDVALVEKLREGIRSLAITDAERRFVRSDGEIFWAECSIDRLRSQNGSDGAGPTLYAAQVRDVTAIRQAGLIAELERSNQELEQFAYIASHDLQEPLRMITSYLNLLQRRYADRLDEDANEFIEFAVDGATRMRALIKSLLVYSRLEADSREFVQVDLTTALQSALQTLGLLIEEQDARVTHDDLPAVWGDEAQFIQLFQNLIENAIKFRREDSPQIHVSATMKNRHWMIAVADNGIGFDPGQAERIFGVFRRLHRHGEYPGTGIGLAICKRIVERHGGTIQATSVPGHGSTFQFTLPIPNE